MNYWDYEEVGLQSFTITPREYEDGGGGTQPFTADTTLFTADSTMQTADQTLIGAVLELPLTADTTLFTADTTLLTADQTKTSTGSGSTVYNIEYSEDGYYDKQYAEAQGVQDGSFLELTAALDLNKDAFYYFRVFVKDANKPEIFRGKAFTYDVLPSKPLHFSMYDDNEING